MKIIREQITQDIDLVWKNLCKVEDGKMFVT